MKDLISWQKKPSLGKSGFKPVLITAALAFILAIALYYVSRNALKYFSLDQTIYQESWSHASWLVVHIAGGILALLLGPFQFLSGLRRRYIGLHRWIGRIYLGSIVISAIAAIYILLFANLSFGFRSGIAGLAFAWVTTSGLAYISIRRGNIIQHSEWMIRSYVVTFGFVMFRFLLDGMNALEIGSIGERVSAVSWMCWAIPLLISELILQGRKIFKSPGKLPEKQQVVG